MMDFPDLRGKKISDFEIKEQVWGAVFADELPDLRHLLLLFDDGSRLKLTATDHHPDNPSVLPDYTESPLEAHLRPPESPPRRRDLSQESFRDLVLGLVAKVGH